MQDPIKNKPELEPEQKKPTALESLAEMGTFIYELAGELAGEEQESHYIYFESAVQQVLKGAIEIISANPQLSKKAATEITTEEWKGIADEVSRQEKAKAKAMLDDIEAAKEEAQKIRSITTQLPAKIIAITSKEVPLLFNGSVEPKQTIQQLENSRPSDLTPVPAAYPKGKPINNKIGISFEMLRDLGMDTKELKQEDEAIHNALLSIWRNSGGGRVETSLTSIYRAVAANSKAKATDVSKQMILDSITRMSGTRILFDDSEYAEKYGKDRHCGIVGLICANIYHTTIAPDSPLENYTDPILMNGNYVEVIVELTDFPLYRVAKSRGQLKEHETAKLRTNININPTTLAIREYLTRRITALENKKSKLSNIIRYDTLYQETRTLKKENGEPYTGRSLITRKATIRKYAKRMLDDWTKTGLIKAYKENKSGNEIVSIEIKI